jgi:prolyl 4-hydroxylase
MVTEINNIIPHDICDKIIQNFSNSLQPASVSAPGQDGFIVDSSSRLADTSPIDGPNIPPLKPLAQYISKITNSPTTHQECWSLIRYKPGGKYEPHYDSFQPEFTEANPRSHSFIFYLNEDYKGGETIFPNKNIKVSPKKGKMIYWKNLNSQNTCNPDTLHSGSPVEEGIKWILVVWVRLFPANDNELNSQGFNLQINKKNGLEYIIIENALNFIDYSQFADTFNYFKSFLNPPNIEESATKNNTLLKNNLSIFLDKNNIKPTPPIQNIINNLLISSLRANNKTHSLWQGMLYALLLSEEYRINNLISYYNKSNSYYKPHYDASKITSLFWFQNGDKNFTGGDFVLPDYNIKIPFKDNSGIIFPSWIRHQVTPLNILNPNKDSGRITYSTFILDQ